MKQFNDAMLVRLLEIDAEHYRKVSALGKLVGDADRLHIDGILDIVLDVLGVPPEEIKCETPNGPIYKFCRDWYRSEWADVIEGRKSIRRFIKRVSVRRTK